MSEKRVINNLYETNKMRVELNEDTICKTFNLKLDTSERKKH